MNENIIFFYPKKVFPFLWEVNKYVRLRFDSADEVEEFSEGLSLYFLRKSKAAAAASFMNESIIAGADLRSLEEDDTWNYVWLDIPPEGDPVLVTDKNFSSKYGTEFMIASYDVESHSWLTWNEEHQQWMIDFEIHPTKWKHLK